MQSQGLDLKKAYYYIICLISFFVLMWGAVDLLSSSVGIFNLQQAVIIPSTEKGEMTMSAEKSEQFFDAFYQKKMLYDRFWDSLARIIIAGGIFAYSRYKVNNLENI